MLMMIRMMINPFIIAILFPLGFLVGVIVAYYLFEMELAEQLLKYEHRRKMREINTWYKWDSK